MQIKTITHNIKDMPRFYASGRLQSICLSRVENSPKVFKS